MADIQAELGDNGKALRDARRRAGQRPARPGRRLRRAVLTGALGQTDERRPHARSARPRPPDRPEPLEALGDILRRKNRFAEAIAAYTARDRPACRIPARDWAAVLRARHRLGARAQWPKAEADFEHALELAPDQPVRAELSRLCLDRAGPQPRRARQMIERAVAQRPNDGAIVDSLGWVLLRQGDTAGAVSSSSARSSWSPRTPPSTAISATPTGRPGGKLEAQFQWRRALDLKPEPEDGPSCRPSSATPRPERSRARTRSPCPRAAAAPTGCSEPARAAR